MGELSDLDPIASATADADAVEARTDSERQPLARGANGESPIGACAGEVDCGECAGSGDVECGICCGDGSAERPCPECRPDGDDIGDEPGCIICEGSGVTGADCDACGGTGLEECPDCAS